MNIKSKHDGTGHTTGQTSQNQNAVCFAPDQISPGNFEVIFYHNNNGIAGYINPDKNQIIMPVFIKS